MRGGGGDGARIPACRAGKRPLVLREQGKAVPAMILRAVGQQGSCNTQAFLHIVIEQTDAEMTALFETKAAVCAKIVAADGDNMYDLHHRRGSLV